MGGGEPRELMLVPGAAVFGQAKAAQPQPFRLQNQILRRQAAVGAALGGVDVQIKNASHTAIILTGAGAIVKDGGVSLSGQLRRQASFRIPGGFRKDIFHHADNLGQEFGGGAPDFPIVHRLEKMGDLPPHGPQAFPAVVELGILFPKGLIPLGFLGGLGRQFDRDEPRPAEKSGRFPDRRTDADRPGRRLPGRISG